MKTINVSAAVITRSVGVSNEIFIAKRPNHLHKGGYWEFPGGKIQPDETAAKALARELAEEIGIAVDAERCKFLFPIVWDYPEKQVELNIFLVDEFGGEPEGLEGQEVKWVRSQDLDQYQFPEANAEIVRWVIENLV